MVSAYSHFGYVTATHTGYFPQTRHNSAAQIFYPCRLSKSYGCSRLVPENELRGTDMPRLRGVNRLRSSTVAEMRICGYRAEEKILCRSPISQRSPLYRYRRALEGKVGVQRGRETMGVPSSLLPRRVPQSPAVPQRTLRPETANRSHGSGTPESLCREIFARKAHAGQLPNVFPCAMPQNALYLFYMT